jgi:hypothetical protein
MELNVVILRSIADKGGSGFQFFRQATEVLPELGIGKRPPDDKLALETPAGPWLHRSNGGAGQHISASSCLGLALPTSDRSI